jgi:acetoin utilization protein AcuA
MRQLKTSGGIVTVKIASSPQEIAELGIDEGLGFFWHHRPALQHEALIKIAGTPHGCIALAISQARVIVGYVTVTLPSEDERWGRDHIEGLYELGGIEVSRAWRHCGIASAMMAELFSNSRYDQAIVIATGYRWCWDYEETGLTIREYRDALHRMMQRYGFQFFETDEPNIAWYPENALVARIGKHAPAKLIQQFKALLFENPGSDYALSEFVGR